MSNRQATPDIMAELMGVDNKTLQPESNKAAKAEDVAVHGERNSNNKTTKQARKKESTQESNKEIKPESNKSSFKAASNLKEKTTFNLSISTLEKLDETWISLRRKLKDKTRITKTLIVEKAIELAVQELEVKGEASALFQSLKNQ